MSARTLACIAAVAIFGAGCSRDDEPRAGTDPPRPATTERDPAPPASKRPAGAKAARPAKCPPELVGCRAANGRILYVEAVDPDGDGDAHFVLLSDEGITAPGISIIDVPKALRPEPLPGPGQRLSGAGRVQIGSHRQKQIEAVDVKVLSARRSK